MDATTPTREHEIAMVEQALTALDGRATQLTREQHAVSNLGRLRQAIEHQSALAYFDDARRRDHAHRLAADAQHLGAHAFSETLHALSLVGTLVTTELAWDNAMLELVEELEAELLAVEAEAGSLWSVVADCIRAAPERFFE